MLIAKKEKPPCQPLTTPPAPAFAKRKLRSCRRGCCAPKAAPHLQPHHRTITQVNHFQAAAASLCFLQAWQATSRATALPCDAAAARVFALACLFPIAPLSLAHPTILPLPPMAPVPLPFPWQPQLRRPLQIGCSPVPPALCPWPHSCSAGLLYWGCTWPLLCTGNGPQASYTGNPGISAGDSHEGRVSCH